MVLTVLTGTVLRADLDWGGGGARFLVYDGGPLSGDSAVAILLSADAGGAIGVYDQGLDVSALLTPGRTVQVGQKQSTVLAVSQDFKDGYLPNAGLPDITQATMEAFGVGVGVTVYMVVIDGVDNPATEALAGARATSVSLYENGNATQPATTYGSVFPMPTSLILPDGATVTVYCDLLPGVTVTLDSPLSGLVTSDAFYSTVSGTALGCRYSLNGAAWIECVSPMLSITLGGLEDGVQVLRVLGGDGMGRWQPERAAEVYSWTVDTVGPAAPVVSGSTPTTQVRPSWSWTSQGGGNGTFRYKYESGGVDAWMTTSTTSFQPAEALSDGVYTLWVQERDDAGNWSDTGSAAIRVDTTPPIIIGVDDFSGTGTAYTWNWDALDADSTVLYRHALTRGTSWIPIGDFGQAVSATADGVGVWFLHVQAMDSLGNVSDVVTAQATLGDRYTIHGTLSYDGVHAGELVLDVFTEPGCEMAVARQVVAQDEQGAFGCDLPVGTYYLRAFCDVNGDGLLGPGEPSGLYGEENGDGVAATVLLPDDAALSFDIVLELWVDYELAIGWNLISFPGTPTGLTPAGLRETVPGVVSIWSGCAVRGPPRACGGLEPLRRGDPGGGSGRLLRPVRPRSGRRDQHPPTVLVLGRSAVPNGQAARAGDGILGLRQMMYEFRNRK
jgi:hypothetical protein